LEYRYRPNKKEKLRIKILSFTVWVLLFKNKNTTKNKIFNPTRFLSLKQTTPQLITTHSLGFF
jgi:hypothetical protein